MAAIGTALQLVFARRGYVLGGVLATLLTAALYAYAGQIVTIFGDGTILRSSSGNARSMPPLKK